MALSSGDNLVGVTVSGNDKGGMGNAKRPIAARKRDFSSTDPSKWNRMKLTASSSPVSGEVVAIEVHHFVPRRRKVLHERLFRVV